MSEQLAVIFDMDGVLVDSYQPHFQSWQRLADENGLEMPERQFAETFGRTSREIIEQLWQSRSFNDHQILALDARKEALYRQIIEEDFPAMDGAEDLLLALDRAGFVLAVGSSGPPENVALALDKLGQRRLFGAVVTGADVTRGKPDPQVFTLAAKQLGIEPSQCAVIEDSPYGIAAANSAGMTSVGVLSNPNVTTSLDAADTTVRTLRDLSPSMIAELIRKRGSDNTQ